MSRFGPETWAALVVALAGAGIVAAVPSQIEEEGGLGVSGVTLPYLMGALILVLGVSLVWSSVRTPGAGVTAGPGGRRAWGPWAAVLTIVGHVLLFDVLGYRLATMGLLLALALLYGLPPRWTFFALVVVTPLVIFVLVERGLIVLLPRGGLGW